MHVKAMEARVAFLRFVCEDAAQCALQVLILVLVLVLVCVCVFVFFFLLLVVVGSSR